MKLGVIVGLNASTSIEEKLEGLHSMGFSSCQINCWDTRMYTPEMAERIQAALDKYGITVSTLWCGWSGRKVWNFYEGQTTLGLVPAYARFQRIADLKAGSDFAKLLSVDQIATHAGFLPENPNTELYAEVVSALREVAAHAKANGQYFLFETGQETPTTLRRVIQDIGLDNLGVNLDPANLILYGKANPVDALDTIGEYVRDVHAKDGCYPTDGKNLGKETPLGKGKVNFPALIAGLKALGYDGPVTIEREISGEQQTRDILEAKALLEALI
ncbi:MAG: sugar phosphate isomerase/epimerase [Clostridia bacterium]|nr:sugar phosphate isomerase/epimerase [Clostridia bacterium]